MKEGARCEIILLQKSPPLESGITILCDNYVEWCVPLEKLEVSDTLETVLNFGTFNLDSPQELAKNGNLIWERGRGQRTCCRTPGNEALCEDNM